jgi:hypothetical protein
MKHFFKLFTLVLVVGLALSTTAWGQLLNENFSYVAASDLAGQGGWTIIGTDGTNLLVANSGLSYTDYPSSGVGNAALITASRADDLTKTFTQQSSGNLYLSCLVNVNGATGAGAYFLAFTVSGTSTSYTGRVYVRIVGTSVNFGLSKSTEAATYSATNYSLNTSYLLVLKVAFIAGTLNDQFSLFIFTDPNLPITEPGTPDIGPLAPASTDNNLGAVLLRQASGLPDLTVDGIRVDNFWSGAPLPIQLASFVGSFVGNGIAKLEWSTISEVNNYGFNVQRLNGENFETIGFVAGKGVPSSYEYIDAEAGTTYRLEQIDNDGLTTYYGPIMLNPNSVGDNVPAVFALNQNYPNPFNPTTIINYQLATDNYTTLKVYNLIGKEVATLVNGYVRAGSHDVTFNGSHLSSGMYFYKLQSGNNVEVKKLTLVK